MANSSTSLPPAPRFSRALSKSAAPESLAASPWLTSGIVPTTVAAPVVRLMVYRVETEGPADVAKTWPSSETTSALKELKSAPSGPNVERVPASGGFCIVSTSSAESIPKSIVDGAPKNLFV